MLVKCHVPSILPTLSLLIFIAHLREKYCNTRIIQMRKERLRGVGGVGRDCVASKWRAWDPHPAWPGGSTCCSIVSRWLGLWESGLKAPAWLLAHSLLVVTLGYVDGENGLMEGSSVTWHHEQGEPSVFHSALEACDVCPSAHSGSSDAKFILVWVSLT